MLCGNPDNLKRAIQMIHETLLEATNIPDNKSVSEDNKCKNTDVLLHIHNKKLNIYH